ncbi:NUDIX hydrolase [Deinococcus misasensis]|uniref:NUDIX hydrolase n=1 Tax=Deinococcus misasensis TaxID=392413 RepID=UPI00055891D1|nr:NUDIX domain-containing protein [Deinococcus misasensis]
MAHVLGFLFDVDGSQVALIHKNRPEWQKGRLNGIGGKIEWGEHPLEAMVREFQEETGLYLPIWEHFATLRGGSFEVFCFVAHSRDIHQVQSCTDEHVEVFPVADLPHHTLFNLKYLIPLALDRHLQRPIQLDYNL